MDDVSSRWDGRLSSGSRNIISSQAAATFITFSKSFIPQLSLLCIKGARLGTSWIIQEEKEREREILTGREVEVVFPLLLKQSCISCSYSEEISFWKWNRSLITFWFPVIWNLPWTTNTTSLSSPSDLRLVSPSSLLFLSFFLHFWILFFLLKSVFFFTLITERDGIEWTLR